MATSTDAVTVHVKIQGDAVGGKACLSLYMNDQSLACASAALAASVECVLAPGETSTTTILQPDMSATQVGKTWAEMIQPSMYVDLDCDASTWTYADGPVFGVMPGQTVEIQLKPKED
mmetsp:Transcript_50785/g.110199  ORF Transcript_50785/g.110199 Transcript_50785/m.110199 type:complete len:118 (+) Transcript_50785:35-388(+)